MCFHCFSHQDHSSGDVFLLFFFKRAPLYRHTLFTWFVNSRVHTLSFLLLIIQARWLLLKMVLKNSWLISSLFPFSTSCDWRQLHPTGWNYILFLNPQILWTLEIYARLYLAFKCVMSLQENAFSMVKMSRFSRWRKGKRVSVCLFVYLFVLNSAKQHNPAPGLLSATKKKSLLLFSFFFFLI